MMDDNHSAPGVSVSSDDVVQAVEASICDTVREDVVSKVRDEKARDFLHYFASYPI